MWHFTSALDNGCGARFASLHVVNESTATRNSVVPYDGPMRALAMIGVLAAAGCGRLGFDDNMDPMNPVLGAPVEAPPNAGLVAHWTFDNMTTSGAMSTVSADMATCSTGECPTAVTGVTGVAARFDGTTSCYHVPSLATLDTASYTISLWVNLDSTAIDQPMIMRYNGGCASPSVRSHGQQTSHAAFDTADVHQYAWTDNVLTAGTWQQIAIRWDGVNQSVGRRAAPCPPACPAPRNGSHSRARRAAG